LVPFRVSPTAEAKKALDLIGAPCALGSGIDSLLGSIIPAFAEGGTVDTPTIAEIGEAGPETVLPDAKLADVARNAGGGQPNVTVNNHTGQPATTRRTNGGRDVEVVVGEMMARDVQRNGPMSRSVGSRFGASTVPLTR
jgi:hypothetical protein